MNEKVQQFLRAIASGLRQLRDGMRLPRRDIPGDEASSEVSVQQGEGEAVVKGLPIEKSQCRSCRSKKVSLLILLEQEGAPPSHRNHSIGYSHIAVFTCQKCGQGEVERFDHDCFDWEEVWDQYEWYVLDASDMSQLRQIIEACPAPGSPYCPCPIHNFLRSSCRELPRSSWEWALEGEHHVHEVSLEMEKGLPTLKVKA